MYPSHLTYEEVQVLDIRQLYIKVVLVHVFKNKINSRNQTETNTETIGLPLTRQQAQGNLLLPRKQSRLGQRHVDFLGPRIFNLMPNEIKNLGSLGQFKLNVKKWLRDSGREHAERLINFHVNL